MCPGMVFQHHFLCDYPVDKGVLLSFCGETKRLEHIDYLDLSGICKDAARQFEGLIQIKLHNPRA